MVDYAELRKELYEKFHDAYHKLYVSELEEEVARLRDVLRINTEQQAEHIKSLLKSWETERSLLTKEIEKLRKQAADASWTVEKYRNEVDDRPNW